MNRKRSRKQHRRLVASQRESDAIKWDIYDRNMSNQLGRLVTKSEAVLIRQEAAEEGADQ